MSKYKVCPTCNEQNDPRSMECSNCGTDLMGIPITDSEIAPVELPLSDEKGKIENTLVRICYCGAINPIQSRKCFQCGEDISDIVPVENKEQKQSTYQLEEIGSSYIFQLPCGSIVVGREHTMRECLANKQYVSRIHAKLTSVNDELYVENLSKTNFTYVNNIRILDGRTHVKVGDEISFGGITINGVRQKEAAYFIVGKKH